MIGVPGDEATFNYRLPVCRTTYMCTCSSIPLLIVFELVLTTQTLLVVVEGGGGEKMI